MTEQPKENNTSEYSALAGKYVLVVEDDTFIHSLIADKLSSVGAHTVSASDGKEGLAKIKESKPDVVLLDILLPGINGYEVLEQIKSSPETKDIPVIIFSNLGQDDEIKKAKDLGAADFLIKATFTMEEILGKISEVCNAQQGETGGNE